MTNLSTETLAEWRAEAEDGVLSTKRMLALIDMIEEMPRLSPVHAMESTWKPGERVEYFSLRARLRRGTVARIDRKYGYHEYLIIAFDDGETRGINPDVMRHIREK